MQSNVLAALLRCCDQLDMNHFAQSIYEDLGPEITFLLMVLTDGDIPQRLLHDVSFRWHLSSIRQLILLTRGSFLSSTMGSVLILLPINSPDNENRSLRTELIQYFGCANSSVVKFATLYWPSDLVSESLFDLPTISSVNDGLEGIS